MMEGRNANFSFFSFWKTVLLILASQRIETVVGDLFGLTNDGMKAPDITTKRGALPSIIEWLILFWVAGKFVCYTFFFIP